MIPAIRSGIDVAFWFLERAGAEGLTLTLKRLMSLLYLAQGEFAGRHGQALMPAVFLAERDGPTEPTIRLVLEAGLQNPWPPEIGPQALSFLADLWLRLGPLPQPALDRLIGADGAWSGTLNQGEGHEITVEQLARAYAQRRAKAAPPQPVAPPKRPNPFDALKLDDRPAPRAEVAPPKPRRPEEKIEPFTDEDLKSGTYAPADLGFTTDGRPIARWKPKRRVE